MKKLSISPSIVKLVKHQGICNGTLHPVSSQIDITSNCNLDCTFCSSKEERSRKKTMDVPTVQGILEKLKKMGCKGIEYTGGGEPLLNPNFEEIVKETSRMGFDIGLITNGTHIPKKSREIWGLFDWVRVSLNSGPYNYKKVHGVEYFQRVLDGLFVLQEQDVFYGISYIYSGQPHYDIEDLTSTLSLCGIAPEYLRIAGDVFGPSVSQKDVSSILKRANIGCGWSIPIDFQINRDLRIPRKCVMGKIKPRIDVYGNTYPCCIAQYKGNNLIGTFGEYSDKINKGEDIDVDTSICPYCIYGDMNDFALELENSEVKNKNFI